MGTDGQKRIGGVSLSYTTYYERWQKINKHDAQRLEEGLERQEIPSPKNVITRRLKFEDPVSGNRDGKYSMCMVDFDENQIYLEFKYVQRGITYKKLTKISKEQCSWLLEGNIEWMAGSKDRLCQDFYRQMTLNYIRPGNIVETYKTVYRWKSDYICLKRSIRSIRNSGYNFFDPNTYMIRCLDYDEVELSQKQAVTIPRFIENMLHGAEETREDVLAFVL